MQSLTDYSMSLDASKIFHNKRFKLALFLPMVTNRRQLPASTSIKKLKNRYYGLGSNQYLRWGNKMISIQRLLLKLHRDERGATVLEYVLIAILVAIIAVAGFTLVGTQVSTKISIVGSGLN